MPLYEYRCTACADRFEEFRPVDAEPPACPACCGASERIFTAPNTEWKPGNVRWDALPSRGFDP